MFTVMVHELSRKVDTYPNIQMKELSPTLLKSNIYFYLSTISHS